ncbi:MAG: DsbC family protein [Steroidobacteraceae bacterium]
MKRSTRYLSLAALLCATAALAATTARHDVTAAAAEPAVAATPQADPLPASASKAVNAPGIDAKVLATVLGRLGVKDPDEVRPAPIPGLYEVRRGTEVVYVSADGKFGISGDLYDLSSQSNVTEERRRAVRLSLLSAVPESQMVIFGSAQARHTVTVFTDVDCGYCQKLHSQIAEYNRLGIRVRYVSFPRTGPDTESWYKAEKVWCSKNRNAALTRAKLGDPLDTDICKDNPVAREYQLGRSIGLTGTPGIVTSRGDLLPGYLPPKDLLEELDSEQAENSKGSKS